MYGLDVRDVGSAALTWGRFGALAERLPEDSVTARSGLSPEEVIWSSLEAQLSAGVIENLRVTNYLLGGLLTAHGAKENPVPLPEPFYRPGVEREQKKSKGLLSLASKMGVERPRPRIT
ncbi:hypothetical protein [Streptomyces bacillaris]|uniref:hypothetical protein n=1 Tax=Streptomyces bacillaris TaxID=68179 RepID=UPI00382B835A